MNGMRLLLAVALVGVSACGEEGPPIPCGTLPGFTLYVGESTMVSPCFTGEALPLVYSVDTTDPDIVSVSLSASSIELMAGKVGQAIITITATDVNGKSAQQVTPVDVPNRPPEVLEVPIPEQMPLWNIYRFHLPDFIIDRDNQALTFDLMRTDTEKLNVSLAGGTLVVRALNRGETDGIVIRATDTEGEDTRVMMPVVVSHPLLYITQGSHGRKRDEPLMAGRRGLLRLFLVADEFGVAMPDVRITIRHRSGLVLQSYDMPGEGMVPLYLDEGDLNQSVNVPVDARFIQNGATVEVDIAETEDLTIPRDIEAVLTVLEVRKLDLTMVPVIFGSDSTAIEEVRQMKERGGDHPLLYQATKLLPVNEVEVFDHDPIHASEDVNDQYETIHRIREVWEREGRRGIYMGLIPFPIGNGRSVLTGQAYTRGARVGFSIISSRTIGHEMGHIFSLNHAPCGNPADVDPYFPYADGTIGIWGYRFETMELLPPTDLDIMGYCGGVWISDYDFGKALRRRSSSGFEPAYQTQVLVVQGWIDEAGNPHLQPAYYVTDTPSRIIDGPYSLTLTGPGGELLTYGFAPDRLADGPGATFYHRIPVWWFSDLRAIELRTPTGVVAIIDEQTDRPYTIVMENGRVISAGPGEPPEARLGREVIFSRGLPKRR